MPALFSPGGPEPSLTVTRRVGFTAVPPATWTAGVGALVGAAAGAAVHPTSPPATRLSTTTRMLAPKVVIERTPLRSGGEMAGPGTGDVHRVVGLVFEVGLDRAGRAAAGGRAFGTRHLGVEAADGHR